MLGRVVRPGSDARLMLVDAGDRDQPAAVTGLDHVPRCLPHADKGAVQVRGDDLSPVVVGGVHQQSRISRTGVVDEDVESAEIIDQHVNHYRA